VVGQLQSYPESDMEALLVVRGVTQKMAISLLGCRHTCDYPIDSCVYYQISRTLLFNKFERKEKSEAAATVILFGRLTDNYRTNQSYELPRF
jgi:hypothetical protein